MFAEFALAAELLRKLLQLLAEGFLFLLAKLFFLQISRICLLWSLVTTRITIPLAAARLGAARCFVAIEDLAAARQTLKELLATQATTLAGVEGQKLLSQVERDLGLTPNATDASQ